MVLQYTMKATAGANKMLSHLINSREIHWKPEAICGYQGIQWLSYTLYVNHISSIWLYITLCLHIFINLALEMIETACGGPGPIEVGSAPALESQELDSTFLSPIHFLICCSAFCLSALLSHSLAFSFPWHIYCFHPIWFFKVGRWLLVWRLNHQIHKNLNNRGTPPHPPPLLTYPLSSSWGVKQEDDYEDSLGCA